MRAIKWVLRFCVTMPVAFVTVTMLFVCLALIKWTDE